MRFSFRDYDPFEDSARLLDLNNHYRNIVLVLGTTIRFRILQGTSRTLRNAIDARFRDYDPFEDSARGQVLVIP